MNSKMGKSGEIISVNISLRKSGPKIPQAEAIAIANYGLEGDGHAGQHHRQVSLLAIESVEKMRKRGLEVSPGDFAENITTKGLELIRLPIGTILEIGQEVILEITQIGKVCHNKCAIFKQVGYCVMPEEGIFARVIRGGKIKKGDLIHVREKK
ncbi:MAG: MOSC domain-containing protein [Candidatus Aminicenantes bacterium]|nr:MOSC domain-containing protein [Candidatus Aminicenantes bacterium]